MFFEDWDIPSSTIYLETPDPRSKASALRFLSTYPFILSKQYRPARRSHESTVVTNPIARRFERGSQSSQLREGYRPGEVCKRVLASPTPARVDWRNPVLGEISKVLRTLQPMRERAEQTGRLCALPLQCRRTFRHSQLAVRSASRSRLEGPQKMVYPRRLAGTRGQEIKGFATCLPWLTRSTSRVHQQGNLLARCPLPDQHLLPIALK